MADEIDEDTSGTRREHTGVVLAEAESGRSEKRGYQLPVHPYEGQARSYTPMERGVNKEPKKDNASLVSKDREILPQTNTSDQRSTGRMERDGHTKNLCVDECLRRRQKGAANTFSDTSQTETSAHSAERECDCSKQLPSRAPPPPPLPEAVMVRALFPDDAELLRALEEGHDRFYEVLKLRLSQHPDYVAKYKRYLSKRPNTILDVEEGGESPSQSSRQIRPREHTDERGDSIRPLSDDPNSFSKSYQQGYRRQNLKSSGKSTRAQLFDFSVSKKSKQRSMAPQLQVCVNLMFGALIVTKLL